MESENTNLIIALQHTMNLDLKESISLEELKAKLIEAINELIQFNFSQLATILYRIDISEEKLKSLLKENQQVDAAKIIASLVIERQLQKIKSRQAYRNTGFIPKEESW